VPFLLAFQLAKAKPTTEDIWKIISWPALTIKTLLIFLSSGKLVTSSLLHRFVMGITFLWVISAVTYIVIFDPFGGYMDKDDYYYSIKVILFPVFVLWSGTIIFKKWL
jgi:hypothetical protein